MKAVRFVVYQVVVLLAIIAAVCLVAERSHAQESRPTIHMLLITVMTQEGKVMAAAFGPYSSQEMCKARAKSEMEMWASKRAMDVTPACAALYVTQQMLDDLVRHEQGEQPKKGGLTI